MRERPRCKYFRRRRCFMPERDCGNCEYYKEWRRKVEFDYAIFQFP